MKPMKNAALAICLSILCGMGVPGEVWAAGPPSPPIHGGEIYPGASATVPIGEYLDLRKKNELPSVTTIEEIYLSGVYGKELSIAFSGTSSGQAQAKQVFDYTDSFSLHDCQGDAILDLAEGEVSLLPTQKRFKFSCKVSVKNWAELEMHLTNALFFRANVTGAEVITDSTEPGSRKVVLSHGRRSTAQADAEVAASGQYQITALPDETRFTYTIVATNPNRGMKPFEIQWPNGERLQKVRTTAEYSENDDGLTVKLPPGDTTIVIQGTLASPKFEPPLQSQHQFVLIENHPTLQLAIDTQARRVGPRDAQMAPQFPSARAYLAGKDASFSWTTKKLELFSTLGYSVKSADYVYYAPENGKGIVEARFRFDNQGTPEIPLEVPGTATYLEINGVPQVLYKNADGKLMLQLGTGVQEVLLQYRTELVHRGLASAMSIDLARPHAVLSNASVSLRTPQKWSLLFGAGLNHIDWDFSFWAMILALLAAAATGALLKGAGFGPRPRASVAVALAFVLFVNPGLFLAWAYLTGACIVVRHREAIFAYARKRVIASIVAAGCVGIGLLFTTALFTSFTRHDRVAGIESMIFNAKRAMNNSYGNSRRSEPKGAAMDEESSLQEAPAPAVGQAQAQSQGGFQGLPARIEIPEDGQLHYFHQGLIDEKGRIKLSAVMVGISLIGALSSLFALFSMAALFRNRQLLVRALRFG